MKGNPTEARYNVERAKIDRERREKRDNQFEEIISILREINIHLERIGGQTQ